MSVLTVRKGPIQSSGLPKVFRVFEACFASAPWASEHHVVVTIREIGGGDRKPTSHLVDCAGSCLISRSGTYVRKAVIDFTSKLLKDEFPGHDCS